MLHWGIKSIVSIIVYPSVSILALRTKLVIERGCKPSVI